MAINFPNSPSLNETYSENDTSWKWDGTSWNRLTGLVGTESSTLSGVGVTQFARRDVNNVITGITTLSTSGVGNTTLNVEGDSRFGSNIKVTGVSTFTGGANIPDSSGSDTALRIGDSQDIKLYHNGSHSYLDNATGDLYIRGNGDDLILEAADDVFITPNDGDSGIKVLGEGSVELYEAGNKKFETTLTGASVTGDLAASGNVTGVAATFTGDVKIGGVLTYEDVKNVDAIGIVTARAGIIDSTLTAGRVTYAGTNGRLVDSANLSFNGSKLNINTTRTTSTNLHVVGGTTSGTSYDTAIFAGGQNSTAGSGARIYLSGCENDPLIRGVMLQSLMTDAGNSHDFIVRVGGAISPTEGERLRIRHNGNVGIGTDDPKTKLNVYTHPHSNTGGILVQNANYSSNVDKAYLIAGTQNWTGAATDWNSYGFQHKLKSDGSGTPRLTIDTSSGGSSLREIITFMTTGKVGIGSDDPNATLDLQSTDTEVLLRLNTKPVKNGYLDIVSDVNRRGVIRFQDTGGTSRWSIGNGDSDELVNTSFHISSGSSGGNTAKFVIDANGRILIGKNTNRTTRLGSNTFSPNMQLESDTVASFSMTRFHTGTSPSRFVLQKGRGTIASPAIVADGDGVGQILFSGWDGDTFTNTAQIRSEVDGTPGDDVMPGNLIFATNSGGTSTSTANLTITSGGNVMINTTNSSSRTLNVKGTFGLLSASQTGVLDFSVTDAGAATIAPYVAGGSSLILSTNPSGSGVSPKVTIASDGQTTIGTGVVNTAKFCISGNYHQIIGQAANDVAALDVYSQHGNDGNRLSFAVSDNRTGSKSNSFVVRGNGNVGINSTSPQAPLDVYKTNGVIALFGDSNLYERLSIRNDVAGYPAIGNESSHDTLDLRSMGCVQATIDSNNNSTGKYFRVMTNGAGNAGTEVFKVTDAGEISGIQDYPNYRPTLDLNFAAVKELDPRITYRRTGPASYVDGFGKVVLVGDNEPRFDHDPATRESRGLLFEHSRINFLKNSDFVSSYGSGNSWTYGVGNDVFSASSGSQLSTNPDGSSPAYHYAPSSTAGYHRFYRTVTVNAYDSSYVASVFVKRVTAGSASNLNRYFEIELSGSFANNPAPTGHSGSHGMSNVTFDLQDLTSEYVGNSAVNSNGIVGDPKIEDYGNGWYRCSYVFNPGRSDGDSTLTGHMWLGHPATLGSESGNEQGNGNPSFYIWGAMVEKGAYISSYIPTHGNFQATRGGEVVSMEGSNVSNLYNELEGTLFAEWVTTEDQANQNLVSFHKDLDSAERVELRATGSNTAQVRLEAVTGSSSTINMTASHSGLGNNTKAAYGFKKDDCAVSVNGGTVSTDSSGNMPSGINSLMIGRASWGTKFDGYVKRILYYPKRLPNSQLITLTS